MRRVADMATALGFRAEVFDGPDERPPLTAVRGELEKADLVIAVLGPDFDLDPPSTRPAEWPTNEAIRADAMKKPVIPVVHARTEVHASLGNPQTYVSFDFRDIESYARNAHHLAKRLLQALAIFRPPRPAMPLFFRRNAHHYTIRSDGTFQYTVTHEAVAREPTGKFFHGVDTGLDLSASAGIELLSPPTLDVTLGPIPTQRSYSCSLELEEPSTHSQRYRVEVVPDVPVGGTINYQRVFLLSNYFPLRADELRGRSKEAGFPDEFKVGSELYYGTTFEVYYETNLLSMTYEFPRSTPLDDYRATALLDRSRTVNAGETTRINSPESLKIERPYDRPVVSLTLRVENPLMGHRYLLLYSLAA